MTVGAALLRQLYGGPPDGFTAARDAAVAEARARGDVAAAKEIAALRKPTIAAWLVNLLAIRRPELLADLAALAGEMRTAQRELRGAELRELSAQRRRVVASLVTEVRKLAAASGVPAGKLPLGEVEDTLNAALSDEEIAESVRSGRLLRPVSYAGFGEVPRPRLRLVTAGDAPAGDASAGEDRAGNDPAGDGPATPHVGGARSGAARARRAEEARAREAAKARRALETAEREALRERERAEADLTAAEDAERAAATAVAALTERIAALQAERAEAEHEVSRRKLARKAAERAAGAARRRHGDAAAALEAVPSTSDDRSSSL